MPVNGESGARRWPEFCLNPPAWIVDQKRTAAQAAGLCFEGKAHAWLIDRLVLEPHQLYLANPWIEHKRPQQSRFLQPDALFFDFQAGTILVIEVKRRFTSAARRQLLETYRPFLLTMFPPELWSLSFLNVVEHCEPGANTFPFHIITSLSDPPLAPGRIPVYHLNLRLERFSG